MIRTTAVGLTFLLLPALLEAQAPADPALASSGAPASVPGVAPGGTDQDPVLQDPAPHLARRELLHYRPFEPGAPAPVSLSERTVFFELFGLAEEGARVILQPPEEVPAVPPAIFAAAGWIVPEGQDAARLGEVLGFAREEDIRFGRASVQPFDRVRIGFLVEGAPQVDDELLLFGIDRTIPGLGDVAVPTGRVRVTAVARDGVEGELIAVYGPVRIGDFVQRTRSFPLSPGVHPVSTEVGIEARLLAFQTRKELHLPGDFAFVDRGRGGGLAVGDEMVGLAEAAEGWPPRPVARFQVVGVTEDRATVRILSMESPDALRPGLMLVLERRMP